MPLYLPGEDEAPEPELETIPHEDHLRSFIADEVDKAGVKPVDSEVNYPSSTVEGLKTSVDEIIVALKKSGLLTS
jgi:hypothetical protein